MAEFKFEKRYKYPHMGPLDAAIWERFIEKYPRAYERVFYDFALGKGAEFDTVVNDETGGDANRLYQYRIDVIGLNSETTDIIEVKPQAGPSSIGQVLGYLELYKRDINTLPPIRAVIITDTMRSEMEHLAKAMGVELIVV